MRYPLVVLPSSFEQALFLIREELKSRRFFNGLQKIGLVDCDYQIHLDDLILQLMELDSSDETFGRYTIIMDKYSEELEADGDLITQQALKVHDELKALSKERNPAVRDFHQH